MAKTMTGKGYIPYAELSKEQQEVVDNPDWLIRHTAAYSGHGLDVLVNDLDPVVRREVAKHGYGLDQLVKDPEDFVRIAVARQGYGFDTLINDEDWRVRREVAHQGYGLDTLINDEVWEVRQAVAKQGYGLDKLQYDESWDVRDVVKAVLDEQALTLEEWITANPSRCALPEYQSRKVDLELDPADELMKEIDELKSEIESLKAENSRLEAALSEYESPQKNDPSLGASIAVDTKLHDKSLADLKLADMEYFEPAQQYVFDNGPDALYIDIVTRDGEKVCDWDLYTAGTKVMGSSLNPGASLDAAKERHAELNGYKPDAKRQKQRVPKEKTAKASLSQDAAAAKVSSQAQSVKKSQMVKQSKGAR